MKKTAISLLFVSCLILTKNANADYYNFVTCNSVSSFFGFDKNILLQIGSFDDEDYEKYEYRESEMDKRDPEHGATSSRYVKRTLSDETLEFSVLGYSSQNFSLKINLNSVFNTNQFNGYLETNQMDWNTTHPKKVTTKVVCVIEDSRIIR